MEYVYMNFAHPNARGTGAALRMELIPAEKACPGSLHFTLAPQKTQPVGFGWGSESLEMYLSPVEAAELLMVFRGHTESIEDGKGIYWRDENSSKVFKACHAIEPLPGYVISITEAEHGGDPHQAYIRLTPAEGIALEAAITGGMKEMMFG